jgi:hypothetical protein
VRLVRVEAAEVVATVAIEVVAELADAVKA